MDNHPDRGRPKALQAPVCVQRDYRGKLRAEDADVSDLAEKLKMPVEDLMKQCNGHAPPSKALVKGVAKELGINESSMEKLAEEVRKDLG